jgi:hypothetical protein
MMSVGSWGITAAVLFLALTLRTLVVHVPTDYFAERHLLSALCLGHGSALFSFTLLLTGIAEAPFIWGIGWMLENGIGRSAAVSGVCACLSICAMGIFSPTWPRMHSLAVGSFFSCLVTTTIYMLIGSAQRMQRERGKVAHWVPLSALLLIILCAFYYVSLSRLCGLECVLYSIHFVQALHAAESGDPATATVGAFQWTMLVLALVSTAVIGIFTYGATRPMSGQAPVHRSILLWNELKSP